MRLALPALAFVFLPLIAACSTDKAASAAAEARGCSIYFSIDGYLKDSGRGAIPSIVRGCPQQYNNIADFSAVDEAAQPKGRTADRLYGEMIDRGVPEDVALIVRRSHAFRDWVRLSDAR